MSRYRTARHTSQHKFDTPASSGPRVVAWLAAALCAVGGVSAATLATAASARADGAVPVDTSTPAGASTQAEATGVPVEVTSETSETTEVMAQPDGSFALTSTLTPVRVMKAGGWVPIDPTLRLNPDGSFSPAASTANAAFSGGGSGPLVRLANGAESVSFSWPNPLPSPVVSGASATYPSVLPGVDLRLTAGADSYSSVLIVRDAAAAANPDLSKLRLAVTAVNLSLSKDSDGGLHAVDSSGTEIFNGSAPIMWDSSSNAQAGPVPTAQDPGGGKVTPIGIAMPTANAAGGPPASTTLTLTPPAAALTGPNVTYPIYLDPGLQKARAHFAVVFNNGWHYYDDTSNDLKVGDCNWPGCNGIGTGRTYLAFDTSALTNQLTTAYIRDADVEVYETWAAHACTPEPVDLYASGNIGPATQWGGPITGTGLDEVNSAKGSNCSDPDKHADYIHFDNADVAQYFQTTANTDKQTTTVALRAPNESDPYQWKRFDSVKLDSNGSPAKIIIDYTFPPKTPSGLSIDNSVDCTSEGAARVWVRQSSADPLTLRASAHDVNWNVETDHSTATKVDFGFHVWQDNTDVADTADRTQVYGNPDASGNADGKWTSTNNTNHPGLLQDGDYRFLVRAYSGAFPGFLDQAEAPSPSDSLYFSIFNGQPTKPDITSFDYPPNDWGLPQTSPTMGRIHLSDDGNVAGFTYTFNGVQPRLTDNTCPSGYDVPGTASGGGRVTATNNAATITLPTLSVGPHTISVTAFDKAHNVSAERSYTFYVAPNHGVTATRLEAEDLASATPVSQPSGQTDTVNIATTNTNWIWSHDQTVQLVPSTTPTDASPHSYSFSFTTPLDDEYEVGLNFDRGTNYGNLRFDIDGQPTYLNGTRVTAKGYSSVNSLPTRYVTLGYPDTAGGPQGGAHFGQNEVHTLTVEIYGKDAASAGYRAGIDLINLVPVTFPRFGDITQAMNNHGLATSAAPVNFEPSSLHAGISAQDFATAGLAVTGQPVTLAGAAFTMPTYGTDGGADNVMADGQFISLTPATAHFVNLLVASTCGAVQNSPAIQININHDPASGDDYFAQSDFPTVPNWTAQSPQLSNITNGAGGVVSIAEATAAPLHRYLGPSQDSTLVHLYVIRVPVAAADVGDPITGVELPYINGSDFRESGCATSPKLHVFAISRTP